MLRAKDTGASAINKKGLKKFFKRTTKKEVQKIFSGDLQNFNNSKIVLSSSRGRGNFRGLEASRPRTSSSRPRTSKCVLEAKEVLEDSTSAGYYFFLLEPVNFGLRLLFLNIHKFSFSFVLKLFSNFIGEMKNKAIQFHSCVNKQRLWLFY